MSPSPLLNWLLHVSEVLPWQLCSFLEKSPLGYFLPLLTSTHLSTQSNSLTTPASIWVMASCCPSVLPAPGVTRFSKFSGIVSASDCPHSWDTLLAVCHLLPFQPPRDFKHLGLRWHGSETYPLWERKEPFSGYP